MLYTLLRAIAGVSLRWFYSRVDTEGLDRIPSKAPVLLAVNHPNALVDALVVCTVCPRRLVITAKATLFANPLLAPLLRAAGVVPLIRAKDVGELKATSDADRNVAAFGALNDALARGRAAMIFPEGITGDHPELAPLRTGAARIALQAYDAGVRDLVVVPVGLTFERKDVPRTRVFVQTGDPITIREWPRLDSESDTRSLTAEIERRLRAVTLNFETLDAAVRDRALAAQLARLFRGVQATPQVWQRYAPLTDQVAIGRRIDAARKQLDQAHRVVRERAEVLLTRLTRFRETLAAHHLVIEDLEIDLEVPAATRFVIRESAVAALAAPFAFWGWLNHWLPFNLARAIAMRSVESAADPAMRTIVGGLALVLASYAAQGTLVGAAFGPWIAALYLISLPVAADVNFYLRARLSRVVQRARAWLRLRRNAALRAQLGAELQWLRSEAVAVEAQLTSPSDRRAAGVSLEV
ncbi:MAG TPA: lysophospholipid acyltransferase family protein [Gemmatimonadaceae bacterium]|nr:lysophospholipid acyltransferase family protein [Gemmatimonadaceae bacterium]